MSLDRYGPGYRWQPRPRRPYRLGLRIAQLAGTIGLALFLAGLMLLGG